MGLARGAGATLAYAPVRGLDEPCVSGVDVVPNLMKAASRGNSGA
jgi:hypothetical protein